MDQQSKELRVHIRSVKEATVQKGLKKLIETKMREAGITGSFQVFQMDRIPGHHLRRGKLSSVRVTGGGEVTFVAQTGDKGTCRECHLKVPKGTERHIASMLEQATGAVKENGKRVSAKELRCQALRENPELILAVLSGRGGLTKSQITDLIKRYLEVSQLSDKDIEREIIDPFIEQHGYLRRVVLPADDQLAAINGEIKIVFGLTDNATIDLGLAIQAETPSLKHLSDLMQTAIDVDSFDEVLHQSVSEQIDDTLTRIAALRARLKELERQRTDITLKRAGRKVSASGAEHVLVQLNKVKSELVV